jgi:hypothetical protein
VDNSDIDVSIIVVAWNVRDLVQDCLQTVYEQTRDISFEIIYVDNASVDGSLEMVRKEFPEARTIANSENLGFIRANNQAIEVARGRYVLLLNSDTLVLDGAIQKTVAFGDGRPDAAVIGCRVLNRDRTLQRSCFMFPSVLNLLLSSTLLARIFPRNRFLGRERMTWWDFDEVREVETVCGCYALVRKEAIDEVGMMDPAYFVYGDDPDWCYRFKQKGWKRLFTPDANIVHYGGQTTKQMADDFVLQLFATKLLFIRIHKGRLACALARIEMALYFLARIPYWIVRAIVRPGAEKRTSQPVRTYLAASWYSLTDWKKLFMNSDEIAELF